MIKYMEFVVVEYIVHVNSLLFSKFCAMLLFHLIKCGLDIVECMFMVSSSYIFFMCQVDDAFFC